MTAATPPRPRGRYAPPLGRYHAGRSWLHRLPAGWSLLLLALVGIAALVLRGPVAALVLLGLVLLATASARVPPSALARACVGIVLVAAVVGAYQWWQRGWATAVEVAADLVAIVVAATLVTATTRADAMLDLVTGGLAPLRRIGVRPDLVALGIGLMLRAIPTLTRTVFDVRDAAKARGLERDPRALLIPAVIRTVGQAHATGQALAARGLGDPDV